ncbi:MAG TPA: DUF2188 domain-containing protein [Gemmatimonadota bacterium]|nr:DUF2188 domain-containing protein [Gemmatimonadota bacterium]
MAKKTKIIAGVAAAAATTGLAVLAAKKRATPDVVYHVTPYGEGWSVKAEGTTSAVSRHPTKKEAVSAARDIAHASAPSRLVIHKQDGAVQQTHEYEPA